MGITVDDIKYYKSAIVTNLESNGGRMGQVEVQSGVRHSLFPRVTKTERTNGVSRYRKQFWANENLDDDTAYDVLQWLGFPSTGGDRFYLRSGDQTNTQADVQDSDQWTGTGQLAVALSGAETSVQLVMENNDFMFFNGEKLHLCDKLETAQTIDSNVSVGDSVYFSGSSWSKVSTTSDISYPYGLCVSSTEVFTVQVGTNEEWVTIAENAYIGEVIGVGDGSDVSPELTTLLNVTNGICSLDGKLPQVSTIDSTDAEMVANFDSSGELIAGTSDASAGELNMVNGVWTLDIVWNSAPKLSQNIVISYSEKPYSYSGNTVTIELEDAVSNAYTTAKTYGSGCVEASTVVANYDSLVKTTSSGVYDDSTYPVVPHNAGAVEDTITLQFTSSTVFDVTGTNLGSLGTGFSVSSDCTPVNPNNSQNMFTLNKLGWSGTWAIGDTIVFDLHPAAEPIWMKEVVPAGTDQEVNNLTVLSYYSE